MGKVCPPFFVLSCKTTASADTKLNSEKLKLEKEKRMSTHLERHRAQLAKLAIPAVERYVAKYPEYTISPDQTGSAGNTNYVIFGHRYQQPVIFKYFCEDERKEREVFAMHHFARTGLVPKLLADVDTRLIIQSRIPGGWLPNPDDSSYPTIDRDIAGYSLGEATATLISVPLTPQDANDYESRFYEGLTLENYLRNILEASWLIHQKVTPYRAPLFAESLGTIEANLPYLLSQTRVLYHQDAMNMHFLESRFSGFFDLEMCRVGTEAMQIGSLWYFFAIHNNWDAFAQGFAATSKRELDERDFNAAQAFAHFLVWRYISRYGRWHADLGDLENLADDEESVADYSRMIMLNNQVAVR